MRSAFSLFGVERRSKLRFDIDQDVCYRTMPFGQSSADVGVGKIQNISSGGVWFTTEDMLRPGMPVELWVNWPALINNVCPIKLVIHGCVVRSSEHDAAIAIKHYEFRTQGRNAIH
jgi:hypothetical protein